MISKSVYSYFHSTAYVPPKPKELDRDVTLKKDKKTYIGSLTPLRGIAAVCVVVYHFDVIAVIAGFSPLVSRDSTMLIAKGYLWVDFFFLLSGFIITHAYGNKLSGKVNGRKVKDYLWARFSRIYPLHLFCLGIHVILFSCLLLGYPEVAEKFSFLYLWEALPLHLVMGEAWGSEYWFTWNVPAWSISAEWLVYMASVFLFPALYQRKTWRLYTTAVLSFAALAFIIKVSDKHTLDVTYDYGSLRCLAEFSLGIILYHIYQNNAGKQWLRRDISFIGASVLTAVLLHGTLSDLFIVPSFGLLILCAAFNSNGVKKALGLKPLRLLGNISYSVYMMQAVWLNIYLMILDTWVVNNPGHILDRHVLFLGVAILLATNLLSAMCTYYYVEIPARKWLRKKTIAAGN